MLLHLGLSFHENILLVRHDKEEEDVHRSHSFVPNILPSEELTAVIPRPDARYHDNEVVLQPVTSLTQLTP